MENTNEIELKISHKYIINLIQIFNYISNQYLTVLHHMRKGNDRNQSQSILQICVLFKFYLYTLS